MYAGNQLGFWLATPPNLYLTGGTATALIVVGGGALKLFYKIICGPNCGASPLTTIEWYLVFAMLSAVLAQLPNLNSIAGLSLVGAITAIMYCTMLWTLSISRERPPGISYTTDQGKSTMEKVFLTLNALGIVAFSFRGHNLAMEIQVTLDHFLQFMQHLGGHCSSILLGCACVSFVVAYVFVLLLHTCMCVRARTYRPHTYIHIDHIQYSHLRVHNSPCMSQTTSDHSFCTFRLLCPQP